MKLLKQEKERNTTQKRANYEECRQALRKVYNACKSDYDTNDELNEAKKKKFDYKQFKLGNKTDKESEPDGETKSFTKEIKKGEKGVDKKDLVDNLVMNLVHQWVNY